MKNVVAKNESNTDRTIRVVLGLVILTVGIAASSWWALVGLVPLITGIVGYCPLYAIVGISTCRPSGASIRPGGGTL